jgi:hypothetical protein
MLVGSPQRPRIDPSGPERRSTTRSIMVPSPSHEWMSRLGGHKDIPSAAVLQTSPAPRCRFDSSDGAEMGEVITTSADRPAGGRADQGVFDLTARDGRAVSAGRRAEGKWREPRPLGRAWQATRRPRYCWSEVVWQGQDSNLCRQCRRFYRSQRRLPAGPLPSPHRPDYSPRRAQTACRQPQPSPDARLFHPVPCGSASGGAKVERTPSAAVPRRSRVGAVWRDLSRSHGHGT